MREIYAKDAREQLRRWDAGDGVWTVSMGGLGPGYEQAIQVLVIELLRDYIDQPIPTDEKELKAWWETFGTEAVRRVDKSCGGFSGAQVGAAKNLAYRFLRDGIAKTLESAEKDRHIQASAFWPRANK